MFILIYLGLKQNKIIILNTILFFGHETHVISIIKLNQNQTRKKNPEFPSETNLNYLIYMKQVSIFVDFMNIITFM